MSRVEASPAADVAPVGQAAAAPDAPFGHFSPTPAQRALIDLANATPLGRGQVRWRVSDLLRWLRPGPLDVERFGLKLRLHHEAGNYSEKKVLLHARHYDRQELAHLFRHDRPQLHFADIGANAGLYSLVLKARRRDARIVAFEPQPAFCRRMRFNAETNRLDHFYVVEAAVGAARGRGRLSDASLRADPHALLSFDVEVVPLLQALREQGFVRLDAMKIDVEGYEDRILFAFFDEAPAEFRPGVIVIEHFHRRFWERDCLRLCEQLGYRRSFRGATNTVLEHAAGMH